MTFCPRTTIWKRNGLWYWHIGKYGSDNAREGTTHTLERAVSHSEIAQQELMTATLVDPATDERGEIWAH